MKNCLKSIPLVLFLLIARTTRAQETVWSRFSSAELSEALLVLKDDGVRSFQLEPDNGAVHRFSFDSDSTFTDHTHRQVYVIRNRIVLPVLTDSSGYYAFYRNKRSEQYDSLHYKVEKFFETDDSVERLTFKTITTIDTVISISYEVPVFTHIVTTKRTDDLVVASSTWLDEGGTSESSVTIRTTKTTAGNSESIEKTYTDSDGSSPDTFLTTVHYDRNRVSKVVLVESGASGGARYEFSQLRYR